MAGKMKSVALLALFVVAAIAGGSQSASAEVNYPWCLIMGARDGSWNCGFVSWNQCMQTRIGMDMCVQNPRYSPAPQGRRRAR
jgi:hypothetical protein